MINEYLFQSDEHRAKVEEYKPDGVAVEISGIDNTPLWVATYSLANKNEESAKKLSDVHTIVLQFSPLVLSCESSEYYNRILFPQVNELERKLRKLLYLAASISDVKEAKENIKQLEDKDFGEIFDLLFIDQHFITNIKKRINADVKSEFNGRSKYSKEELKTYVDSLEELPLWDTILGEKDVQTLRTRFRDVQSYRNDVMHAHNISKELFGKARYLFDKINNELDIAIGKLIRASEDNPDEPKPEVNTAISSAIAAMDLSALTDAFKNSSMSPALLEMSSQMSKVLEGIPPFVANSAIANYSAVAEALKSIQPLKENSALAEALRNANAFLTSPVMENFRRQMSQFSEAVRPYLLMFDALRPYDALQEKLRSITEGLPHNLDTDNESDEADAEEPESDNNEENPEESNPNE
jgi:hypothetical protein